MVYASSCCHLDLFDDIQTAVVSEERRAHGGQEDGLQIPTAAMIRDLMNPGDSFRRDLQADVEEATERLGSLRSDRSAFRRAVMTFLRESGYNAGICKSRWGSGGGINSGSHEYIDVMRSAARYIVDLEFAAEFEIARPTAEYDRVLAELPGVVVVRAEEMRRALRLLAEAAKRSLASQEMHVPPWRKHAYVHAKWLGPYRRTTNSSSASATPVVSSTAAAAAKQRRLAEVQCRAVGFRPMPMDEMIGIK